MRSVLSATACSISGMPRCHARDVPPNISFMLSNLRPGYFFTQCPVIVTL